MSFRNNEYVIGLLDRLVYLGFVFGLSGLRDFGWFLKVS